MKTQIHSLELVFGCGEQDANLSIKITHNIFHLAECGIKLQTRIVGGTASKKNAWPWLAALLRPSSTGSGQYCGAAIISKRHILTAAHCVAP